MWKSLGAYLENNVTSAESKHSACDPRYLSCESTGSDFVPLDGIYRIVFSRVLLRELGKCGENVGERSILVGVIQIEETCEYCEDFGERCYPVDAILVDMVCAVQ